jgi:hypothetical protein
MDSSEMQHRAEWDITFDSALKWVTILHGGALVKGICLIGSKAAAPNRQKKKPNMSCPKGFALPSRLAHRLEEGTFASHCSLNVFGFAS